MQDFQLYDRAKIEEINKREQEIMQKAEEHQAMIDQLKKQAATANPGSVSQIMEQIAEMEGMKDKLVLSEAEEAEREKLEAEGFADWNRKDFRAFTNAVEIHGRYELDKIVEEVSNNTSKGAFGVLVPDWFPPRLFV